MSLITALTTSMALPAQTTSRNRAIEKHSSSKPFSCLLLTHFRPEQAERNKKSLHLHSGGAVNVQQWQKLVMLPMWHPKTGWCTQIGQAVYRVLPRGILSPLSPMRPLWQSSSVPPQMKETGTEEDKATAGYIGHYICQGECVDWQPLAF